MVTLLERTTAGFSVRVGYCPDTGLWLSGVTELHSASAAIPPEKASNAFLHPCCYLDNPARFFRAETLTEEEDGEGDGEAIESFREYGGESDTIYRDEEDDGA